MSVTRPRRSRLLRMGIVAALLGLGMALSAVPLVVVGTAQARVVADDPTPDPTATDPVATDAPSDSASPSEEASPTPEVTDEPTLEPTDEPDPTPTPTRTPKPSKPAKPTAQPSDEATDEPTDEPTDEASDEPTDEASDEPTDEASDEPTDEASDEASDEPTDEPTDEASDEASDEPTDEASDEPTDEPTATSSEVSISLDGAVGAGAGSATVVASGAGLAPGSRVEVWVFSTPVLLATGAADDSGTFSISASLPADLPPGDHSLVLRGTGADGQPVEVASGFSIGPDGTLTSANEPVDAATVASLTAAMPPVPTSAKTPPYAPVQALDNPTAVVTTAIAGLAVVSVVGAAAGAASAGRGASGGSCGAGGAPHGAAGDDPAGGGINEGTQKRRDEVPDVASSERSWRSAFTPQGTAWGDHSALHRLPLTPIVDEASYRLPLAVATTSPLLGRIAGDAAPVRAMVGSASIVLPVAGLVLGVVAALNGDGIAQPPALGFLVALIAIGILDALSGLVAATAFSAVVALSGGIVGWDSVRTLLGVALLIVGPGLIGSSFRSIRRRAGAGGRYVWERLTDLVVVPLFAAYVTYNIATSLPPLGGSLFPIADQAMTLSVVVLVLMVLKVVLEEVAARWFPERLATVLPRELPEPGVVQQVVSAGVRTALFLFISAAFVGNVWQLWVAGVLFLIPAVLEPFSDRFRNVPAVWRVLPEGVSLLALILLISLVISSALESSLTDGALYARMAFVVLLIPDLVLGVMGAFGRHGRPGEERWYLRPNLVAVYRVGGVAMLLVAVWLVAATSGG